MLSIAVGLESYLPVKASSRNLSTLSPTAKPLSLRVFIKRRRPEDRFA